MSENAKSRAIRRTLSHDPRYKDSQKDVSYDPRNLDNQRDVSNDPRHLDSQRGASYNPRYLDTQRNVSNDPRYPDNRTDVSYNPRYPDSQRDVSYNPRYPDNQRNVSNDPRHPDSQRNVSNYPRHPDSQRNASYIPQNIDRQTNQWNKQTSPAHIPRYRPNSNPHDIGNDSTLGNIQRPDYIPSRTKINEGTILNREDGGQSQIRTTTNMHTIRQESIVSKPYILWIDTKDNENATIANHLESDGHIHIDFFNTFSSLQDYLRKNMRQIKSSPFQIISRGYYKNEDKNPMDLLLFLNQNDLKHVPVIVFTKDKSGLEAHLAPQGSSKGVYDWKDRLCIITNPQLLIAKCKSNIAN
ncbi:unnamed protein product [Rotaria magnacalcarata]|uniref:Uncharacterized protein n=1 Tax=Rotaria magnacalcarata TaxID=392030 RepID=A0A819EUR0_9BILA|nr:unnamed protein product [Rotaria magnacalcarata]CAF3856749.1 unnamed protein product [Rotaria magnacalcarata]